MTEGYVERARRIASGKGFAELVGMKLDMAEVDHCRVRLPYRLELSRGDELIQGGAIATLVDVAGTAAAWCSDDIAPGSASR
jgi:acyl-coenzyme A thioesterase PaaI-like protein